MATPDPFEKTFSQTPKVSKHEHIIAGILCNVYGLDELSSSTRPVTCLWLLHPRLSNSTRMEPIGAAAIAAWNSQPNQRRGLIAVSFDQRNHGTRLQSDRANEAWGKGNKMHAQDMFSIFHGTAMDTSHLINYIHAYAFPENDHDITDNIVLGVSLGGHAVWHCLMQDPRITAGVSIIGCTDYARLMSQRADKSKLESWHSTSPPGKTFLGSKDFPKALLAIVDKSDPTGLLMTKMLPRGVTATDAEREPSEEEKGTLLPLMKQHFNGKRIFNLAGGADKLVPYSCSEPFLVWLKNAIKPGGWFESGMVLKDEVYDGVGHEMTPKMMSDAVQFVIDTLKVEKDAVAKI
jgi:pimeloyl-ACP methyl ester carboxylesterase